MSETSETPIQRGPRWLPETGLGPKADAFKAAADAFNLEPVNVDQLEVGRKIYYLSGDTTPKGTEKIGATVTFVDKSNGEIGFFDEGNKINCRLNISPGMHGPGRPLLYWEKVETPNEATK